MSQFFRDLVKLSDKDRLIRRSKDEKELQESDFKDLNPIASDDMVAVISAVSQKTNQKVALKKIKKKNLKDSQLHLKVQQEIDALSQLNHNNIIKLYTYFETKKSIFLVQELANAGSIKTEMIRLENKKFQINLVREWIKQILGALLYIHSENCIHGGLATENILLYKQNPQRAAIVKLSKVCDFRNSFPYQKCFYENIESIPPECYRNEAPTYQSDLWNLGIVIYQLISGKHPFEVNEKNKQKKISLIKDKILNNKYNPFPDSFPKEAQDLVVRLLRNEPNKRLKLIETINHHWITGQQQILSPLPIPKITYEPLSNNVDKFKTIDLVDLEVDKYQEDRVQRRSRLGRSVLEFHTPQLKPRDMFQDDYGNVNKQVLERMMTVQEVRESQAVEDEPKPIVLDHKSVSLNARNAIYITPCENVEFTQVAKLDKKSGVEGDIERTSSRLDEYYFQTLNQVESRQNRSGTLYNNPNIAKIITPESKIEAAITNHREKLKNLEYELKQLKEKKEELQFDLSLFSKNDDYQPRESMVTQAVTRQSTINYQNFDSETKVDYYKLLSSKIPKLKNQKFCLKSTLAQQIEKLKELDEAEQFNNNQKMEIQKLLETRAIYRNYCDSHLQQIQELNNNIHHMQLEKEYIITLERIENYMGEYILPPRQEFKDTEWLKQILETFEQKNNQLSRNRIKKNSLDYESIIQLTEDSESKLVDGQSLDRSQLKKRMIQSKLESQSQSQESKFQAKLREYEILFQKQQQDNQQKIEHLKLVIENNQKLISSHDPEKLKKIQDQCADYKEKMRALEKEEQELKLELSVQMKNIQFVQESLK